LVESYTIQSARQYTKAQLLALIDELARRLGE
jgi:hypothetical protein